MRKIFLIAGCLCLLVLGAAPVQAVTLHDLSITLNDAGDAQVHMGYELSLLEYTAVYLNLANPATLIADNLRSALNRPVTVGKVDSNSVELSIQSFASVANENGAVTISTPQLSFASAQTALKQYWFAPLITTDFTPETTTVTFPDGYQSVYKEQITLPAITHTLG